MAEPDIICDTAPEGLLAELTYRCPLQCPYCSNPLEMEKANLEMPTEQWVDIFRQAADMGILQIHLSGGEPALRSDLPHLVAKAAEFGLYTNLITSGVTFSREKVKALADSGLDHVQISIQDSDPVNADRIASYKDGYVKKRKLAGWLQDAGIPITINAPVHRQNIEHLENIINLALELGAIRLEVAHVQYYGWALLNRAALMPTREQALKSEKLVNIAREELRGILNIDFVPPDYYARYPKPCMGGWGKRVINITPSGKVLPCHGAETIKHLRFDNVSNCNLLDIWLNSEAFKAYRGTGWMKEPCRSCDLKERDWGGCRCQALAMTGDAANADPACHKSEFHNDLIKLAEQEALTEPPAFIYRNINTFSK